MSGSPHLKVYRDGEYVASCKYYEDAAMLVAINGVVKYGHGKIIWREGQEEIEAGESYDHASDIMRARVRAIHERSDAKAFAARLPIPAEQHERDEDCTVGDDDLCHECGVFHGGPPCPECGKFAFHTNDCPELFS